MWRLAIFTFSGIHLMKKLIPLCTSRLYIDHFGPGDAPFILELLNSEGWLRHIGPRDVSDIDRAAAYIREKLNAGNEADLGCFAIRLLESRQPVGLLSFLQRDYLDAPDIGYALHPDHYGNGYALEATQAFLLHIAASSPEKVYAIVSPGNARSEHLLGKLQFTFTGSIRSDQGELRCFELTGRII